MPRSTFSTAVLIGGPAASGKTTIARLVARRRGLRWYSTDAHGWSHRARAVAQGLHSVDDPSPGTFDRGSLIHADLERLAAEPPVAGAIVEGALITPDLAPLLRSVWLMPSADEQRRRLVARSGSAMIHHGLTYGHRMIADQLSGTSARVIDVDGQSIDETLSAVETVLAPALDDLHHAQSTADRQQVIRYGNTSLVDQVRASINSGHIDAESLAIARTFDCECGQVACNALVELRPGTAALLTSEPPGAVRAANHSPGADRHAH